MSLQNGEVHLKMSDTIQMNNFIADKEYTIKGSVHDMDDLTRVLATNEIKVTPDSEIAYSTSMDFEFTTNLKENGNSFLVKQEVYLGDTLIFVHFDSTDDNEKINLITVYSDALDVNSSSRQGTVDEDTTLRDTIHLMNVRPGYVYEVTNYALWVNPESTESTEVAGLRTVKTVNAAKSDEDVVFDHIINTSDFAGKTIVFCAEIRHNGVLIGIHYDLANERQTIHFPKIWTMAKDEKTLEHFASWDDEGKTKFIDTVFYENVLVGLPQYVTGILMDKDTEKPMGDEGIISRSEEFTPETSSGTVVVEYEVDAKLYEGRTSVCFEDLVVNDAIVTSHRDINDEGQTIKLFRERTHAYWMRDGVQYDCVEAKDEAITLEDRVDYWNLDTSKEYTQNATLYNQETGAPILRDGKPITASVTFTPEKPDGYVIVKFELKTKELEGTKINVFEDLFYEGIKVCSHADLTDESQTVTVKPRHPKTGDIPLIPIGATLAFIGGLGLVISLLKKRRR